MKKKLVEIIGCALIGGGLCVAPAAADIAFDGALVGTSMGYSDSTFFGSGPWNVGFGTVTVDVFCFDVLTAGTITFDMFSFDEYDTWIDPQITLFADDGSLDAADYLADNDDYIVGSDTNSSSFEWDSYMEIFLGIGSYKIAVGSYETTIADAVAGSSSDSYLFSAVGDGDAAMGRYHLDILGDVSSMAVVPLPPAALGGLGLLGCLAVKRRLRK